MKVILSNQAAKRLKKEVESVKDFVPDVNSWRVDCLALRKRGIFLITNEKTLYTYISGYKKGLGGILEKIRNSQEKRLEKLKIDYLKFSNRKIISSMNYLKTAISGLDKYTPLANEEIEEIINKTPLKYLSDRSPAEVHKLVLKARAN